MQWYAVEMSFDADENLRRQWRPAHRDYWQGLADRGVLVGGGLWPDGNGGLLMCRATDEDALWSIVHADPYAIGGVITGVRVRRWNVQMGERLLDPPEPPSDLREPDLTPHEHRIARLVLDGKTNQEIARQFQVSSRAVELHLTSMYRKLGISRRAQLARALSLVALAV